jgi:hypothetical protein
VVDMQSEYFFLAATEPELNELLAGRAAGSPSHWMGRSAPLRLPTGSTGVLWSKPLSSSDPIQPLVLISREADQRRLFGRFAQLRSDLSPLTAWCHLLAPQRFESLDSLTRCADFYGFQAAWSGLIVAEALLLTEWPLAKLRISACLATQSFALARAKALWFGPSTGEILRRFDDAQQLLRNEDGPHRGESRIGRIRAALQPIWASLAAASDTPAAPGSQELRPIVESLRRLELARSNKNPNEARQFVAPLEESIPEARDVGNVADLTPEQRLRVFDEILEHLGSPNIGREQFRRIALTLLAGYLVTIAAGGSPTLSLATTNAARWPEITAWAYVLGSIGERVVWTSSFDGLGRLVARELLRPLRLDEPPTCDFALDEASVLVDTKLSDPLVHLRIKQSRNVSVSLLPGVNIFISIGDSSQEASRPPDPKTSRQAGASTAAPSDTLAILADAIWPYLRIRLEQSVRSVQGSDAARRDSDDSQQSRGRKHGSQSGLPLKNSQK